MSSFFLHYENEIRFFMIKQVHPISRLISVYASFDAPDAILLRGKKVINREKTNFPIHKMQIKRFYTRNFGFRHRSGV